MQKTINLNQVTAAALPGMPTAELLELLDELEFRAYLVRTAAGIRLAHGGHFMRCCVDALQALRDAGATDPQVLHDALQDGAALASLGIDDVDVVEYLHGVAMSQSALLVVFTGADPVRAQLFDNERSALLWCDRANRRQDKTRGEYRAVTLGEYLAPDRRPAVR